MTSTLTFLFEHAYPSAPAGQLWCGDQLARCMHYIEANWSSQTDKFKQDNLYVAWTTTAGDSPLEIATIPKANLEASFRAIPAAKEFVEEFVAKFKNRRVPFVWLFSRKEGKVVWCALATVSEL